MYVSVYEYVPYLTVRMYVCDFRLRYSTGTVRYRTSFFSKNKNCLSLRTVRYVVEREREHKKSYKKAPMVPVPYSNGTVLTQLVPGILK